ncbi:MAG: PEP-CTERM sorting domain-containing protein [Fimbriimonadaceae bacterium]|jgi:hypothetical protein|nr:PEP-CTERM sorting domain-containing protein [Fimbriimonadaceae bacterium]
MKLKFTLIALGVLAGSMAFANIEPNAFLVRRATNHEALLNQVKAEQRVMQRYMRHFGMSREQVLEMLQGLRLEGLKEDGVYLVYNVPDNTEELKARAMFYRRGTAVWVDAAGNVVLKESCGNPMMRGTDSISQELEPVSTVVKAKPTPMAGEVAIPATEASSLLASTVPMSLASSAQPFVAGVPSSLTGIGSRFNPAFLLPLAAVPIFARDGGGADPIPEPGTMIALALGAGAVIAKRRKAKAQK